jgi:hypothetical protein
MMGGSITGNTATAGSNVSVDSSVIRWQGGDIGNAGSNGIARSGFTLRGWNTEQYWEGSWYASKPAGVPVYPEWSGDGSSDLIAITNRTELAAIGNTATTLSYFYGLANDITITTQWIPLGDFRLHGGSGDDL